MDVKSYKTSVVVAAVADKKVPLPPPLPYPATRSYDRRSNVLIGHSCVPTRTKETWERLFSEGYRTDVKIKTDGGGYIYAHSNILGVACPAMKGLLKQSKRQGRQRSITVGGVPHNAVRVFIKYLYSSSYEKQELEELVLHLLVLSHVFAVPELKKICVQRLEKGFLTTENVIDIFQLALLCDAPPLSLACHRIILMNFEQISLTEGWKAMRESHPILEKEIVDSMFADRFKQKERIRKLKERKIYLQLYEAMEALVHICRDGCKTIGPYDKEFKENKAPCNYSACKGLESLVRHFAACKQRVQGGCIHCKRMWQLLELHSRLCADSDMCRVPLCKNFKVRIRTQSKKDEVKWRILVKKIIRTKTIGGSPFFSSAAIAFNS